MVSMEVKKPRRALSYLEICVKAFLFSMLALLAVAMVKSGGNTKAAESSLRKSFSVDTTAITSNFWSSNLQEPSVVEPTPQPELKSCLTLQTSGDVDTRYTPRPEETDKCLLYQEPSPYLKLLTRILVGTPIEGAYHGRANVIKPYDEKLRYYGNDWPPFGYTMVGTARLENFRAAIHEVDRNNIPGAIVELGVWRGGAMMMASGITQEAKSGRDLYVYDAFESIPGYGGHASFLENSEEDVKSYFETFELLTPNVHFVKGLFKDTVPNWKKGTPVAVLRVDGNFYDSYQDALYAMYEDVPIGGIVIFDDVMSHPPVMRCWKDFKRDHGVPEELNRIDTHSTWFRKTHDTKIDQTKKHPPQDVNK